MLRCDTHGTLPARRNLRASRGMSYVQWSCSGLTHAEFIDRKQVPDFDGLKSDFVITIIAVGIRFSFPFYFILFLFLLL